MHARFMLEAFGQILCGYDDGRGAVLHAVWSTCSGKLARVDIGKFCCKDCGVLAAFAGMNLDDHDGVFFRIYAGRRCGARTRDPLIKSQVLSQLS